MNDAASPSLSLSLPALSSPGGSAASRATRPAFGSGPGRGRLLAGLLAVVTLAGCGKSGDAPAPAKAPPEVGVIVVQRQRQQIEASLPGRTRASLTAEVRPQVSGILQKRLFTEGALVRQGQPLYQIDDASLRATEASAQAALAKAEATARTQEATAKRNAELVKIDAISQQAFEESQAAAAQSRSDVAVAQANLATARINLKYSRIEAPISGRISLSNVTPGALVTANQADALTSIVQLDPMYVDFTQSTTELMQLQRDWDAGRFQKVEGDKIPVRIRLDDGTEYAQRGQLQFAGVIVNATTGTVTLRAVVPNPKGTLMPGMYVRAQLATSVAPEALLLPQEAVLRNAAGDPSVQIVDADNKLIKRPVVLGQAVGNRWLVISGVKAGEKVMVDGFQKARVGQTVQPTEVKPREKAAAGAGARASAAGAAASAPEAAASTASGARP